MDEGWNPPKLADGTFIVQKKQNDPKLFLPFPYLRQPEVLLGLFGADEELAVVMDLHHGDAPPPAIVLLFPGKEIRLLLKGQGVPQRYRLLFFAWYDAVLFQ